MRPRPLSEADIPVHTADLANGEKLYNAGGCRSCHKASPDLPGVDADEDISCPDLFTLGDRPEDRWSAARDWLERIFAGWEILLLETGFLAIFLPPWAYSRTGSRQSPPPVVIIWLLRWLLFRVMFGFGKQKFMGSTNKDLAYLKGFLIARPALGGSQLINKRRKAFAQWCGDADHLVGT